eukprot:scaffold238290_cov18-Tisochrysis_lutea.AAC.1
MAVGASTAEMGMHVPGSQALHPSAAAVLHGPWSVKPSYQIWALVCQSHPTIPVVHLTRRSKANLPYLKALRALDLKGNQVPRGYSIGRREDLLTGSASAACCGCPEHPGGASVARGQDWLGVVEQEAQKHCSSLVGCKPYPTDQHIRRHRQASHSSHQ